MENEEKDLSNKTVTSNGIIADVSGGAEIPCPTCGMKGRVPDPKCFGKVMMYSHPNGDRVPHITCRTCNGTGWVFQHLR